MCGRGIVYLFTESRKVYEVVLDRAINFELRYSGTRQLRCFDTVLRRPYTDIHISIAIKGILSMSDRYKLFASD